jgi:hypothetical protein
MMFGGKVMVETFLSLWLLSIYALASALLERPNRAVGAALGLVAGLALLTKLTIALFLPSALVYVLLSASRRGSNRRSFVRTLAWAGVICLAVAGPWYARNAGSALRFAIFSSRYNELALGRSDRVDAARRLALMVGDLPGWPLTITAAAAAMAGLAVGARGRDVGCALLPNETCSEAHRDFSRMAWLGAGTGAAILLVPSYFDPRFLLPVWPSVAIDLGTRLGVLLTRSGSIHRLALGLGLGASVLTAPLVLTAEPSYRTYWKTAGLIDDLVERYGISQLVNVGNCASWNVCKTGLVNELRQDPGSCFVLHDMTRLSADSVRQRLNRAEAVVVLGRTELDEVVLQQSPGFNCGYDTVIHSLNEDARFSLVTLPAKTGLPELSVFVRREKLKPVEGISKLKGPDRRYQ